MKKITILFLLFIINFEFLWGTTLNTDKVIFLTELLEKAEKDLYNYAAPWELMESEFCKDIKEISNIYLQECILILEDINISVLKKHILVNILNWEVDFTWYKKFLYELSKEYERNKIDDEIIIDSFINSYSNYIIVKNYKDKIIKNAIDTCLSKKNITSNMKSFFTDLKTGATWRNYRWRNFLKKIGFISPLS